MYLIKWVYFNGQQLGGYKKFDFIKENFSFNQEFHFLLIVLSLAGLAAAGYIINDVSDTTEDSINKPKKQIIDIHITKKNALRIYWLIQLFCSLIGLYLAVIYRSFFIPFSLFTVFGLLWLYSKRWKSKYLIGNIVVGLTSGSTVLIAALFIQNYLFSLPEYPTMLPQIYDPLALDFDEFLWGISGFIFGMIALLTIAREIVKDIQDIEGDKIAGAKTIPIVSGIFISKIITSLTLLIYLTPFFYAVDYPIRFFIIPIILLTIICLFISRSKKGFGLTSMLLKLNMLLGMIFIIYVAIEN